MILLFTLMIHGDVVYTAMYNIAIMTLQSGHIVQYRGISAL